MTHFACIAIGNADFMPDEQIYIEAATGDELRAIVAQHCQQWQADLADNYPASDEFYAYEFRVPAEGENNYSQRLRVAGMGDWVLDVIGMTEAEFERESN